MEVNGKMITLFDWLFGKNISEILDKLQKDVSIILIEIKNIKSIFENELKRRAEYDSRHIDDNIL